MKSIAIAVGSIVAAVAVTAVAQPNYRDSPPYRGSGLECWNPRAGHFEKVRPAERQDDLDFGRCRSAGGDVRYMREWRSGGYECWNPRADHFEDVRQGEHQDDLDFSRCRPVRAARYIRESRWAGYECWNPRARHFEEVREGERQDDLDFSRCRRM